MKDLTETNICQDLNEVRENIDRVDNEIIKLIAERGVRDSGRVEAVIAKARAKAEQYGAEPDVVETVYRNMIAAFINMEMKQFKG